MEKIVFNLRYSLLRFPPFLNFSLRTLLGEPAVCLKKNIFFFSNGAKANNCFFNVIQFLLFGFVIFSSRISVRFSSYHENDSFVEKAIEIGSLLTALFVSDLHRLEMKMFSRNCFPHIQLV